MVFININDLIELRKKYKNEIIVYCSGSFDLFHVGHVLFFEECKKHGDILVVAVGNDSVIKGLKGNQRPILNEKMRVKVVDSLKIVDYTVLDPLPFNKNYGDRIFIHDDMPIIERLKPDKWIINNDSYGIHVKKEFTKKLGVELIILERTCPKEYDHISTSKIIEKIKALK